MSKSVLTLAIGAALLVTAVASAQSRTARLWASRYDGPASQLDQPQALAVAPDGSKLFVTGSIAGNEDYGTIAYDAASGAPLWVKRYSGPGRGDDGATAAGISPDGSRLFVTGTSTGSGGNYDYATVAYDAATGKMLWASRYDGANNFDAARSLGVSPDGSKVFVTGMSVGSGTDFDYETVAYDAATGKLLWASRYDGPGNGADQATALGVDPDGSKVFVTGYSTGAGSGYDYATIAYDAATGNELWVKRYDVHGDYSLALGISPDGSRLFVTGTSSPAGSGYGDYATIAYDAAAGTELWVRRYGTPQERGSDVADALGVSPDGSRLFVTGHASQGNDDYTTIAYDAATGSRLWLKRFDGTGHGKDIARALGVSPDGSTLFVTGESVGSRTDSDYATVAYSALSGARLWVKRYNGPPNGSDDAFALGVGPDGSKVFVTGGSTGSGTGWDYATVAYSAG